MRHSAREAVTAWQAGHCEHAARASAGGGAEGGTGWGARDGARGARAWGAGRDSPVVVWPARLRAMVGAGVHGVARPNRCGCRCAVSRCARWHVRRCWHALVAPVTLAAAVSALSRAIDTCRADRSGSVGAPHAAWAAHGIGVHHLRVPAATHTADWGWRPPHDARSRAPSGWPSVVCARGPRGRLPHPNRTQTGPPSRAAGRVALFCERRGAACACAHHFVARCGCKRG